MTDIKIQHFICAHYGLDMTHGELASETGWTIAQIVTFAKRRNLRDCEHLTKICTPTQGFEVAKHVRKASREDQYRRSE